jgi:uncharacterized protein (DUF924 family)
MSSLMEWRPIYDFWFHKDLSNAEVKEHWRMLAWWMGGGANADLPRFISVLDAARSGQLDHWRSTPLGRLSLIIVLDQFARGLHAGKPEAYASDLDTLRIVEEGFQNRHYEGLTNRYEQFFYSLPLAHAEGPDHMDRMRRVVDASEKAVADAPEHLRPLWVFSLSQARANYDVIERFGRFPHRNAILGRESTAEELIYLEKGDFVYNRTLPISAH